MALQAATPNRSKPAQEIKSSVIPDSGSISAGYSRARLKRRIGAKPIRKGCNTEARDTGPYSTKSVFDHPRKSNKPHYFHNCFLFSSLLLSPQKIHSARDELSAPLSESQCAEQAERNVIAEAKHIHLDRFNTLPVWLRILFPRWKQDGGQEWCPASQDHFPFLLCAPTLRGHSLLTLFCAIKTSMFLRQHSRSMFLNHSNCWFNTALDLLSSFTILLQAQSSRPGHFSLKVHGSA